MIIEDPKDIIGNTYGDMLVKNYLGSTNNHVKIYEVECLKCGKVKNIQYSRLNRMETVYHNNKVGFYLEEYDENIGVTINDYTIVKRTNRKYRTEFYYLAKCNICGTTFETTIGNFKRGYGTHHNTCSIHLEHSKYLKRFKKIYSCMRYRTTNENYNEYEYYGGRGISSDYFSDFIVFYNEMFPSYIEHCKEYGSKDTTIERIDVNGNYETSNCRWATCKEQANNKRDNRWVIYDNQKYTTTMLCELLGLNYANVINRINNLNWDIYESFEVDRNKHSLSFLKEKEDKVA